MIVAIAIAAIVAGTAAIAWMIVAEFRTVAAMDRAAAEAVGDLADLAYDTLPCGRPLDGSHERYDDATDLWRELTGEYLERMWSQPVAEVDR